MLPSTSFYLLLIALLCLQTVDFLHLSSTVFLVSLGVGFGLMGPLPEVEPLSHNFLSLENITVHLTEIAIKSGDRDGVNFQCLGFFFNLSPQ